MKAKRDIEIASFPQSARCPVVKQPNLAAIHSEVVGGDFEKHKLIVKVK